MVRIVLVAALVLVGCDKDTCDPPRHYPATGSGAVTAGELVPGAQDQRIAVSADHKVLEYTFTRNGTTVTARYALSEGPPAHPLYFVKIQRTPPHGDCAALAGHGPVIDAIEVKRGGLVIGSATAFYAASCGELTGTTPVELNGPPDGVGLALAGNELGWALGERRTLVSGDEVTITVLDTAGEPFDVYGSWQQTSHDMKLGTLTGTGTLTVP